MSSVVSSTGTSSSTAASSTATGSTVLSSTGIGSGLDITSIVAGLTTAEGLAANTQLSDRKAALTAQVSAYGTFASALDTLQATLGTLETSASLAGRIASVSDDTVATATATTSAVPASYSLTVQNLASAASLSSAPVASGDTVIGTGTLSISVGGSTSSITIDSTDNTLSGIAAAINGAPDNPGVTASILTTSAGSRLVLSGTSTGAANAITVSQSGGDGGLSVLAYDPATAVSTTTGTTTTSTTPGGLTQTQAAQDANFTINGYPGASSSNQVSSTISGVTINLLKTTAADAPTTVTVGADTTGAQTSIGTFVTALNGLITSIQSLTSYDPSTNTAGPLLGNATLESFQNQLSKVLDQVTSGASVSGLLSGQNGIAAQLDTLITSYTQSGGLLDSVNQGLQSGLTDVANQQTALNARLATYSATLTQEYNAMDTAVALLKQTQTYLTAEFNSTSSSSSSTSLSSGSVSG